MQTSRHDVRESLRLLIREVLDGFSMVGGRTFDVPHNQRYDVATTGHTGANILDDEEDDEARLKRAACVLVKRSDGKVLGVSRGKDTTQWGLPGGKVLSDEDFDEGCTREVFEETGLMLTDPHEVFRHESPGKHMTATFIGDVSGKIRGSDEGIVRWIDPRILLDPEHSPFVEYAKELFSKLNIA